MAWLDDLQASTLTVLDRVSSLRPKGPRKRVRRALGDILTWAVLGTAGITMVFPLVWMVATSLKARSEIYILPPRLFPARPLWENYPTAFQYVPYGRMFLNSFIAALLVTIGRVMLSTFTGFSFSRLHYPGRDKIFLLYLIVLMIPFPVTLVPMYLLVRSLGWIDRLQAIIVPPMFSAYNTFLARQFMMGLPDELEDSARIDGASPLVLYARIIMPLCKPLISTMVILSFTMSWNWVVWPMMVLSSAKRLTLPIGLIMLKESYTSLTVVDWNILMAAASAAALPTIIVFLVAQRYFIQGIALTGLKG